jgi:trimeric autotransporter adhesin
VRRCGTSVPTATWRRSPPPPTVYIGGHFTSVGGTARGHLAALHPTSGALFSWNPGANGVFGAFAAATGSSHLAFGGEFTQVASQAHQGIVQFPGTP